METSESVKGEINEIYGNYDWLFVNAFCLGCAFQILLLRNLAFFSWCCCIVFFFFGLENYSIFQLLWISLYSGKEVSFYFELSLIKHWGSFIFM